MNIFFDLFYILKGKFSKKKSHEYKFAFLVHSRGYKDIYRKYPKLKLIPKTIVIFIMNHLWPITLSKVTGIYSIKTKEHVKGYVLGIPMTSQEMMSNRDSSLTKIRQALYLARGKGVTIVGLGGLTSSLSAGGKSLLDIDMHVTTGHAYTAYNVTQNLFKLVEIFEMSKEQVRVAVVGAAGSVGSLSVLLIARAGFGSITLIDLKRKDLSELETRVRNMRPDMTVFISHEVKDIKSCNFVITATNTPDALITKELVEDGMVIIDDAQPSDIHPDVLKLENVLVIEAGVVDTPGVKSNFNYGLKSKTDNFCCMTELLILASHGWDKHYIIERATLEHVDEISKMGDDLGFKIASFQNFLESISQQKIEHVKSIIKKNAIHS